MGGSQFKKNAYRNNNMKAPLIIMSILLMTSYINCHPTSAEECNSIDCKNNRDDSDEKEDPPTPIVLWHGLGDSCCAEGSIGKIKTFIENMIENDVHVISIEIGVNMLKDLENSYFKNSNTQIDIVCQKLNADKALKFGYHAVGFSQGAQFLRAVAQRCPNPPMLNLISMGGQHQGVFGLPRCPGDNSTICDYVRKLLNYGVYNYFVQRLLVPAQYWHDSTNENEYKSKSIFLADINNENSKNETYKTNLMNLRNFVLVKFAKDRVVDPPETEWFGFYTPGQSQNITALRDSQLYKEDWLGLREMDQKQKLHFLQVEGDHLQFSLDWFRENIIDTFLKQKITNPRTDMF